MQATRPICSIPIPLGKTPTPHASCISQGLRSNATICSFFVSYTASTTSRSSISFQAVFFLGGIRMLRMGHVAFMVWASRSKSSGVSMKMFILLALEMKWPALLTVRLFSASENKKAWYSHQSCVQLTGVAMRASLSQGTLFLSTT